LARAPKGGTATGETAPHDLEPRTAKDQAVDLNVYFKDPPDAFAAAFDTAARAAEPSGQPFFLKRDFISRACLEVQIPPDATQTLLELLETLARQDELSRVVATLHELGFGAQPLPPGRWPEFIGPLHEHEVCINLLLILSALPRLHTRYETMGISAEIRCATFLDVPLWLKHLQADAGLIGLSRRILDWLYGPFTADLFRLGRLQFHHRAQFDYPCAFYRNRRSGRLVALAKNGARVNAGGFLLQPGEELAWTASLEADDRQIRGFLIEPRGTVSASLRYRQHSGQGHSGSADREDHRLGRRLGKRRDVEPGQEDHGRAAAHARAGPAGGVGSAGLPGQGGWRPCSSQSCGAGVWRYHPPEGVRAGVARGTARNKPAAGTGLPAAMSPSRRQHGKCGKGRVMCLQRPVPVGS